MTIIDYTCTVPVSYWMLGQNVSHINTSSADLWEVRLLPGLSFTGVDHVVTNYLGHHDLVQVEHQTLMFQLGRTVSKLKTLDFESNWPKSFHEFSAFQKKPDVLVVGARAEFLNGMDLLVFRNQFGASDLSSKLQSSPQEQPASDTIWIPWYPLPHRGAWTMWSNHHRNRRYLED